MHIIFFAFVQSGLTLIGLTIGLVILVSAIVLVSFMLQKKLRPHRREDIEVALRHLENELRNITVNIDIAERSLNLKIRDKLPGFYREKAQIELSIAAARGSLKQIRLADLGHEITELNKEIEASKAAGDKTSLVAHYADRAALVGELQSLEEQDRV